MISYGILGVKSKIIINSLDCNPKFLNLAAAIHGGALCYTNCMENAPKRTIPVTNPPSLPIGNRAGMNTSAWPVLREYSGAKLRHVQMPVGGIGTGQVSLRGNGGLAAFEIRNSADKNFTPCRQGVHPAFVVRTKDAEGAVSARLLEGPLDKSLYEGAFGCAAPNHG